MGRFVAVIGVLFVAGMLGTQVFSGEEELAKGKVLQRVEIAGVKGKEVLLVLRELPPGKESGKHHQSGTEVSYVLDGSAIFEMQGKAPVTLKAGDTFRTGPHQVHNVKNVSATTPAKVLVFYVVEKGKGLADISTPAK